MSMRTTLCLAALATAATTLGAAAGKEDAAPVLTGPEASIQFATSGGIYDFHVVNDQGVWVQARGGQWYYAKFFTPCIGIQFSNVLGFVPGKGDGAFDRWGSVVSHDAGRCTLVSLRASEAPAGVTPKKTKAAEKK